jgi:tRNA A58 N-methylase Trm61
MSLDACFKALTSQASSSFVAIDPAHAFFITSTVAAKKPENILELGVGSAYLSYCLLAAAAFNRKGSVVCVDNLCDWNGQVPAHLEQLKLSGATLLIEEERAFLSSAPSNHFDVIISDANHLCAHEYVEDVFRVAQDKAFIFFHDTNNTMFPNLIRIKMFVQRAGYHHYEFVERSRPEERTERGLLFVIKNRDS